MSKANNSPTNWKEGLTEADKSDMLSVLESFRQMPPVRKDDVEEVKERLDMYFNKCAEYGFIPTVESMCLALGVSRQALWKWQKNNYEAGELIERAKEIINSMLTTATLQGKVNFAFTIWLQKNHFGYSDSQRLEVANVTDKRPLPDSELPKLLDAKIKHEQETLPRLSTEELEENT